MIFKKNVKFDVFDINSKNMGALIIENAYRSDCKTFIGNVIEVFDKNNERIGWQWVHPIYDSHGNPAYQTYYPQESVFDENYRSKINSVVYLTSGFAGWILEPVEDK